MTQQWIRQSQLLIQSDNLTIDLSNLQFQFTTSAAIIGTPKVINIKIFNVAGNTIQQILNEGLVIILNAGYNGNISTIFTGQIRQVTQGKENGVDSFITIRATDGDSFFKDGFVSMTVAAGSTPNSRLYSMAQSIGVDVNYSALDDKTKLPFGRTYYGKMKEHIRTLSAQANCDWFIEDGKINVVERGSYLNQEVTVINASTGMIGLPIQTIDGIHVKTLLNPGIKQGCAIELNNASIQALQQNFSNSEAAQWSLTTSPISPNGIYKVIAVSHDGDNRGQKWYSDIICSAITGNLTPSQLKFSLGLPQ